MLKNLRAVTYYLLHVLLATLGVMVCSGFLAFELLPASEARKLLTTIPYFPIQIVLAFSLGFLLRLRIKQYLMEWVWVLPSAFLCIGFFLSPLTYHERFDRFFGSDCSPSNHCFDQTGLTLPFYTAIAYSLGAMVSSKVRTRIRITHGSA
jgi:hypothetical protein